MHAVAAARAPFFPSNSRCSVVHPPHRAPAAAASLQNAFDQLIGAAYELLAEGKPMEAEYLLAEGATGRTGELCVAARAELPT